MGSPAIMTNTGINSPKSQGAMRGANPENFNVFFSGQMMREPKRMIYVHSVAKRGFGPLSRPTMPKISLRGCENGERYVISAVIPDPIPQSAPDEANGGFRIYEHNGLLAAQDLLAPAGASRNTNLLNEGLFVSLNEIPTEEEIRKAEKARDDRFRYLTREALRLAAVSTRDLNEWLQEYPDTHIAMDSLGLTAPWHQRNEVQATCPNCGDQVKQGIAFHQSSAGILCVLDPARALKSGAITKERYEDLVTEPDAPVPAKKRV